MRLLVIGADGQLGRQLIARAGAVDGITVLGTTREDLDITDPRAVGAQFAAFSPEVVVNCAAWTAVDAAETNEEAAHAVNATGPGIIADAAAARGSWMVQLSTDYVFDGNGTRPYRVDDPTGPRSAYGRTKLAGEQAVAERLPDAHYIVRTAWLYDTQGSNFPRTMIRLAGEREFVDVVDDQHGQPTYARDLAEQLLMLIHARPAAGVFHGTNSGETTWFEFARAVFSGIDANPERVRPTTSDAFAAPAPRPAYSVLDDSKWAEVGLTPMRPWRVALDAAFADGLGA